MAVQAEVFQRRGVLVLEAERLYLSALDCMEGNVEVVRRAWLEKQSDFEEGLLLGFLRYLCDLLSPGSLPDIHGFLVLMHVAHLLIEHTKPIEQIVHASFIYLAETLLSQEVN